MSHAVISADISGSCSANPIWERNCFTATFWVSPYTGKRRALFGRTSWLIKSKIKVKYHMTGFECVVNSLHFRSWRQSAYLRVASLRVHIMMHSAQHVLCSNYGMLKTKFNYYGALMSRGKHLIGWTLVRAWTYHYREGAKVDGAEPPIPQDSFYPHYTWIFEHHRGREVAEDLQVRGQRSL